MRQGADAWRSHHHVQRHHRSRTGAEGAKASRQCDGCHKVEEFHESRQDPKIT